MRYSLVAVDRGSMAGSAGCPPLYSRHCLLETRVMDRRGSATSWWRFRMMCCCPTGGEPPLATIARNAASAPRRRCGASTAPLWSRRPAAAQPASLPLPSTPLARAAQELVTHELATPLCNHSVRGRPRRVSRSVSRRGLRRRTDVPDLCCTISASPKSPTVNSDSNKASLGAAGEILRLRDRSRRSRRGRRASSPAGATSYLGTPRP